MKSYSTHLSLCLLVTISFVQSLDAEPLKGSAEKHVIVVRHLEISEGPNGVVTRLYVPGGFAELGDDGVYATDRHQPLESGIGSVKILRCDCSRDDSYKTGLPIIRCGMHEKNVLEHFETRK